MWPLGGSRLRFCTEPQADFCVSTSVVVEITITTAALVRYYLVTSLVDGGLPGLRAMVAEKPDHHAPNTKLLEGLTPMRNKLHTMIAVCSLAVLAISPAALACDKGKKVAAQLGTQQVVVAQVADGASTCSKSRQVVKTVSVADASSCATQSCATQCAMKTLAKAIYQTKGSCSDDCASRAAIVAAYRTMAGANPDFACKATLASLKGGKTGGSAKPTAVVATVSGGKQCCAGKGQAKATTVANAPAWHDAACAAAKAKATKVAAGQSTCNKAKAQATKVANPANCDPAACAAAKAKATNVAAGQSACCSKAKARATKVANAANCDPAACAAAKATKVAAGKSARSSAAKASYVAFGCKKTDRVARAAAVAYLEIMRELQVYSGAKGCSLDTASKLLASVLNDMQDQRTATVAATPTTDAVANIETSPVVSFGAVSDAKKKTCGAGKN